MKKEKVRKYIILFSKISVAVFAVWYLFKSGKLTSESFTKLFTINNTPFIILAAFAFLGAQMLAATRLIFLLRTIDFPLRFSQGFKFTMIGNFFNIIIPGTVGGDLVKSFYLIKNEHNSKGRSLGIVAMDRILGLLALVFIGGISIIYLFQQNSTSLSSYQNEIFIAFIVIGFLLSLFMIFLFFGRNWRLRKKLKEIFTTIFRRSVFYHMTEGFGILAKNRQILIYSFLISLLIQLISLAGLLILGNVVSGSLPDLIALVAASSVVMLIGVIPVTPGNLGWTELIAAFSWSAVGSNAGAEIFLYWRIVVVSCSLPLGLLFLFIARNHGRMLRVQKYSVI